MKRSFWARIAAAALAGCLMAGAAGCRQGGDTSGDASGGQVKTFNGAKLKVSIWTDSTIPALGKSDVGDARYYALEQAKEKFDCDVEWVVLTESQYFDAFVQASLSGTVYSHIALQHSNTVLSWIKEKLVAPTDDFIGEDPDHHWNNSYAMFKGVNYGLSPNTLIPLPYQYMLYNTRLIQEMDVTSPQQLVREGKWTWDVFRDYCKKASAISKDTYGVAAYMLPDCLRYTNDVYLWKNVDGKYYNGYSHPASKNAALELLTFLQDMKLKDGSIMGDRTGGSTPANEAFSAFTDGSLLFMYHGNYAAALKATGFTDYAPVTYPVGPSSSEYFNMRDGFSIWGIPTTNDYEAADLAAFWMYAQTTWDSSRGDAYYVPNTEDAIDTLYASSYQTREDAAFLYEMGAKMTEKASLNSLLSLSGTEVNSIYYPILSGESTPAAVIEATDSLIQSRIDEVFNSDD